MVDVIGRAKVVVETAIDKSSLDTTEGKIGSTLKKGAVVGVAALGTLTVAGLKAFQSFEQAEAQSRKLNQVLDNMGKSKALPAVESLADELSRLSGVDDDLIKQGETLLATFSNVAESAGESGGVFERATRAAVDLSATGFGSVESASVMLGKALQDPLKGVTALGRAGVTFSETQKQQIENFIQANDLASAQALILKEVEKQVGGTAEATATESEKIRTAFGELEDSTGNLVSKLIGGGKKGGLSGAIRDLSDDLNDLAESDDWQKLGKDLRGAASDAGTLASKLGSAAVKTNKLADEIPLLKDALKLARNPFGTLLDYVTDFDDKIRELMGQLARLKGRIRDVFGDEHFTPPSVKGGTVDILDSTFGSAGGGRVGPGLRLVGENGPEIVSMGSSGGYVHNNSETERMLTNASAQPAVTNLNFYGPTSLSQARREADWARTYGTRFGTAAGAGAL